VKGHGASGGRPARVAGRRSHLGRQRHRVRVAGGCDADVEADARMLGTARRAVSLLSRVGRDAHAGLRKGEVRITVLARPGRPGDCSTPTSPSSLRRTSGPARHLHSLDNDHISLQIGSWGGTRGEVQFATGRCEEAGLTTSAPAGTPSRCAPARPRPAVEEGTDFERIADPKLAPHKGHRRLAPRPHRSSAGRCGRRHRAAACRGITGGDHKSQVVACPSDPAFSTCWTIRPSE